MRRILAATCGTLFLFLAACGTEAGPTPKQGADPGPGALSVKLDALMTDACYRQPAAAPSPGCEKYVTQIANVPGTAQKYAGTKHPELADAATRLAGGVSAYRDQHCDATAEPGCPDALGAIATALAEVKTGVAALPTSG